MDPGRQLQADKDGCLSETVATGTHATQFGQKLEEAEEQGQSGEGHANGNEYLNDEVARQFHGVSALRRSGAMRQTKRP